ncbi:MAG TPA: MFS transporter [Opitutaceae bacterium]|nr:MFS transporter [Opitutaceae bacterium]
MKAKPYPTSASKVGGYRWRILGLLFAATTINYMDRSVLGVLAPTLQYKVFHWSDQDYAAVNIAFKSAYAIGLVSMGAVIDKVGTRAGYAIAIAVWSLFGMLHALVRPAFSLVGFCVARFGLGLGESGNFPAAIKTTAEWFPRRERAYATGIFNAGANVGAIMAPLIIPMVVLPDGTHWQYAFLTTGLLSLIWIVVWLKTYRPPAKHPGVGPEELSYINSDSPTTSGAKIPWSKVIPHRETWAFSLAKITDAAWWFYLFWGGKYLYDRFGLDIKGLALPLVIIFAVSDAGSVAGGWLSSTLIKRGWSVNRSRKTALFVSALCVLPVVFVPLINTRFATDDGFYQRLAGPSVKSPPVPAEVQTLLLAIKGQSFASAREFDAAVTAKLGSAAEVKFEGTLLADARTDRLYWIAVFLMALAAAGHQAWSCNLYTLVSDVFPKAATASVIGFGGMFGAVAGLVADWSLGHVLSASGPSAYLFAFLGAGSAYLIFLGVIQILMPRMTPLGDDLRHTTEISS